MRRLLNRFGYFGEHVSSLKVMQVVVGLEEDFGTLDTGDPGMPGSVAKGE